MFMLATSHALSMSATTTSRQTRRQIGGLVSAGLASLASTAMAAPLDDEFLLADTDKNGKLSKSEFALWYRGNELLNEPVGLSLPSLPVIALDFTAIAGAVVGIYAVSYAYYTQQILAEERASAEKKAKAAAKKLAAAQAAESSNDAAPAS